MLEDLQLNPYATKDHELGVDSEEGEPLANGFAKPETVAPGQFSLSEEASGKIKTSLRLRYEAEARVIRKQLGDLETIREKLGLSRRKMCQLLMVDPSSWTRWMKGDAVPPHIYRALQWYLALIEKQPVWHPQNSFQPRPALDTEINELQQRIELMQRRYEDDKSQVLSVVGVALEEKMADLQHKMDQVLAADWHQQRVGASWKMLLLINLVITATVVFFFFAK